MEYNEHEVREAAETLLRSTDIHPNQNVQSPNLDMSHSHSINTIPSIRPEYVFTDDLLAGYRINGRMSNIRRFFCMFVTFDLLFTCLMWLICIMLHGENIMVALKEEVLHYDIHSSLFDIVLVAVCRFTILLLFYALLYINNWIVIALSTSGTCVFLLGKVFFYNWQKSNQPVFEVLLVLVSFILAWGEAWFLDFRVFPQEIRASQILISSPDSERAPLLQSYIQSLPAPRTESVFYSPRDSLAGSFRHFDINNSTFVNYPMAREQEELYKNLGNTTFNEAITIFQSSNWKPQKAHSNGNEIFLQDSPKLGKIYMLKTTLNVSPYFVLQELFYNIESMVEWNPDIIEIRKLQILDEFTDITYQVTKEAGGGIIGRRDFVSIRHWKRMDDNTYFIATKKTEHPLKPAKANSEYVRAELGITGYVLSPVPGEIDKCQMQWFMNLNLNGQLPKMLVNGALIKVMLSFSDTLKTHLSFSKCEKS